jgi:hypothetical protein
MKTITIMGRPAATVVDLAEPTGPRPATGKHLEALGELENTAKALLKYIEAERSGVCDGQGFWIGRDPVLGLSTRLKFLAEQRIGLPR